MNDTQELTRTEVIAAEPAEALAAILDIASPVGGDVPEMWHWVYLLPRYATAQLGPDGHALTGIPAPAEPGQRRMFAGGRVRTFGRLVVGEAATKRSWVSSSVGKKGRSGPLTFVTVRTEISQAGAPVIVEEQDIVYRAPAAASAQPSQSVPSPHPAQPATPAPTDTPDLALEVDEALLFRFSAVTFNAHRIHYDPGWAAHEGYDGLVVHGPLQALMMSELARRSGMSLVDNQFNYRLVSPLVGIQPVSVYAEPGGLAAGVEVRTADGRTTAVATFVPPTL